MARDVTIDASLDGLRRAGLAICKASAERFAAAAKAAGVAGVEVKTDGDSIVVETSDPAAVAREFGTERESPRPWVRPLLQELRR